MSNKRINQEFIDEVIAKNDIVTTVSKYVTLSRRGNNYWCCCPFHMEKTPSMSIKAEDQFFKCFGCGVGGNVINFIMQIENVDFMTALEILCKNAGMEMPTLEGTSEMQAQKKHRDTLLNILRSSCEFYQSNLNNPKANSHIEYIHKRGLGPDMISKFKIGASLDFYGLPKHLHSQGFDYKDMQEAGVVGLGEQGTYYDFYGGRITFPIFNGLGEVVGFSGRDITGNPEKAKYKNTPQTLLFNKSALIYGYNFLRELKRNKELDSIILVEGQMDVIACHSVGITNAVGCLGTALTQNHARDLSHLCGNIILCLDGDNAGANATYKAMTILREANMNIRVVRLTGAKDPDEYIKAFGKDKFVECLADSMDYMEFILIDLSHKYNLKLNNERNEYINEALKYLSKLATASEQEIYLSVLKEIVNVPIDALRRTLTGAKADDKKIEKPVEEKVDMVADNLVFDAMQLVLASILYKKVANPKDFLDVMENAPQEYKEIMDYLLANQTVNISTVYSEFNIAPNSLWDKVINFRFPADEIFNVYFNESVRRLRITLLKQKRSELSLDLKNISTMEEMMQKVGAIKDIDARIKRLEELR